MSDETGSLRNGDETRRRIVEAALQDAAQRGLGTVSLGDLAQRVGLSKSGVVKHFPRKGSLELAVVDEATRRFAEVVRAPAARLPAGRPRLRAIFDGWLRWEDELWPLTGCPLKALSTELDDQPGPARDLLKARLAEFRTAVAAEIRLLREPALTEAEARTAYFELRSYFLGYSDARRMMGDVSAQKQLIDSLDGLLDRTASGGAAAPRPVPI